MSFGSTFSSVYGIGMQAAARQQELELEKQREARAAEEQALRMRAQRLQLGQQEQIADVRNQIAGQWGQNVYNPSDVQAATGLRAPSVQMLQSGQGGYGTGAAAVDAAAGDFAREAMRAGVPAQPTPSVAGLPTAKYDRAASIPDRERLAILTGDNAGLAALREEHMQLDREHTFRTRGEQWDTMSPEDKSAWIQKHSMNADIPMYGTMEKKGKYTVFVQGRPSVQLGEADMRHLYIAEGLTGDPIGKQQLLGQASDKLRALAKDLIGVQEKTAGLNNTAAHYEGQDQIALARLGIDRARLDQEKIGKMGPVTWGQDAQGNPVGVVPVLGPNGMSMQQVKMPEGVRLQRPVDIQQQRAIAQDLVGTPTGRKVPKPGIFGGTTDEVHTPQTAWDAAGRMLSGQTASGDAAVLQQIADAIKKNRPQEKTAKGVESGSPEIPVKASERFNDAGVQRLKQQLGAPKNTVVSPGVIDVNRPGLRTVPLPTEDPQDALFRYMNGR